MSVKIKNTANPDANTKAQAVLNYLYRLSTSDAKENKLIAAHWIGAAINPDIVSKEDCDEAYFTFKEINEFHAQTGKWVGMVEAWTDGAWIDPNKYDPIKDCMWFGDIKKGLIEFWNNGGLVKIGSSFWAPLETGYAIRNSDKVDYEALMISGTATNKNFWALAKHIGDFFSELQKEGVVIIYRPFTELYLPTTFWYSRMPHDQFIHLWRQLFDYFTNDRKLNNILWDFNYDKSSPKYPGDEYVDLYHAHSIYKNGLIYTQDSNSLPWGQGELGWQVDYHAWVEKVKKEVPYMCYFLTWDRGWGPYGHPVYGIKNKMGNIMGSTEYNSSYNKVLNDPYIITRDKIHL